jgi:hypothetical protein
MELLSRLERALEGLVEGIFTRAFRAPVQPIEIAKRLMREAEMHKTVSVHTTYVPNHFRVRLAPETVALLTPISGQLLAELEQYLREYIAEQGYLTAGPLAVRLLEGPGVKIGEIDIEALADATAVPSAPPPPGSLRIQAEKPTHHATAEQTEQTILLTATATGLEIVSGPLTGQYLPLTDGFTIGRAPTNTLPLADTGVSRLHVRINWEEEQWVLTDTGSTNGTYVGDHRITAHPLRVGETIRVGSTSLVVR